MKSLMKGAMAVVLTFGAIGCATHVKESTGWTAYGYLSPAPTSEPEEIGDFPTESECRAAVDGWMSRQVVGNPVSGDCLPIDRH